MRASVQKFFFAMFVGGVVSIAAPAEFPSIRSVPASAQSRVRAAFNAAGNRTYRPGLRELPGTGDSTRVFFTDDNDPGSLYWFNPETEDLRSISSPEPGASIRSFEERTYGENYFTLTTAAGNVYASGDGGLHWALRWDAAVSSPALVVSTFSSASGQLLVIASDSLWFFEPEEESWTRLAQAPQSFTNLAVDRTGRTVVASAGELLFLATRGNPDVPDFNVHVSKASFGQIDAIGIDTGDPAILAIAAAGLFHLTTDAGDSWRTTTVAGPNPLTTNVHSLAVMTEEGGARRIYAGTDAGLFVSYSDGLSWFQDTVLVGSPVTSVITRSDGAGLHLALTSGGREVTASDRGNPCPYEQNRYILGSGPRGFDNYIDVGAKEADYYVALVNKGDNASCSALPYLPGMAMFVGNTPWIKSFGIRYIDSYSASAAWNLRRGSYLFRISVTSNAASGGVTPSFRQRAFYLDKPRGSYSGRSVGYVQAAVSNNGQPNHCDLIPQDGSITPPTRNQSVAQFRPHISCPNYRGTVTFIACGGQNQGIRSVYVNGLHESLMAAASSDKTTCVVVNPYDE